MSAEEKIKSLGLVLPKSSGALGSYLPCLQVGEMLYLSGVLSRMASGDVFTGRAGDDPLERGQQAARLAVLTALGNIKEHLGSLDRIKRIVRLIGYVQSSEDFQDHPKVLNGASDFLISIFGDSGRHSRSAVGVLSLPMGALVELELTVQVEGN